MTGTVTVNGKPVDNGGIEFVPLAHGTNGKPAVRVGSIIVDGRYAVDATLGPFPGKYRVEIFWLKSSGKKLHNGDGGEMESRTQVLPAKYNSDSELTAEITGGENKLDFALTQ